MRALIFCAGLGTRLKPLTDKIPKPLIEVGGKPVLDHIIKHLRFYGIDEIMINIHHHHQQFLDYYGDELLYFYEPELLGEKETYRRVRNWFGDEYHFLVNGDTITDLNINEMFDVVARTTQPIQSKDKGVYTGITLMPPTKAEGDTYKSYDFGCDWIDIGTPEGLKKARERCK